MHLNNCDLYNDDCLTVLPKITDRSVQLVMTSPPYFGLEDKYVGETTKQSLISYIYWQEKIIAECRRICADNGSICWQVGNSVINGEVIPLDALFYRIGKELGLKLRNRIVWTFGHGLHCSKRFSGRHETVLWFTKNDDYLFNLDPVRVPQKYPDKKHYKGPNKGKLSGNPFGKNPTDVWDIPNVKNNHPEKTEHPCQFPLELCNRLILSLTNEGDTVCDPFMGSGTSAESSLINKRKFIGIEKESKYFEIARKRIDGI